ncbi:MAG: phytanoyl-CoA dioxygenase family protein [Abitibacteriaceae bacterium]|nr:phytanoyl-CoA dioxygenase family protein [Abditibacteriaceae bacterium]MBV9866601.1 phytanoyl-CoA dioxygenase family protein [Abditibacteriaceae bacterium]
MAESTTQETYKPFIESDTNADPSQLRSVMAEQGYLFFRGLVPADEVLTVRRQALELCQEAGWLDESQDLMEGIVASGVQPTSEGKPEYMAMYRKLLKLPRFHDFPCHPALMQIAQHLLGGEVFVHPRRIGRVTFPNYTVATTPAHQDHFYIRGTVDTYSCWIPLGTCPITLGGLAVWPGSHQRGFLEHSVSHPGAVGGRGVPVDETEAVWHTGDFGLGDTLFFHAYTIHKALPNLSGNRLRVSTDNRYQRKGDDIDPGALRPHFDLN